jgi:hypothetical protein
MQLLFKRIVRTSESEQYGLFDRDQLDEDQLPLSLGKVDLHYTVHGTFATLLLWAACFDDYSGEDMQEFVEAVIDEFTAPMGVPEEFLVETSKVSDQDLYAYSNMVETELEGDDE